ncbi:hypothetical protein [Cohaesibacter celericrescens]|uniref:Uncharacterized protein n=1 Tax=Cohaesibacter celericrescens TaxID=2067669 RepID=A0A2N5XQT5_9HYPH|nr:hypothetical protein [Cohaesibacter celericrescens]PLW76825.1 hypothetical protein C0081_12250 [Cohaesibacter celericrescens]
MLYIYSEIAAIIIAVLIVYLIKRGPKSRTKEALHHRMALKEALPQTKATVKNGSQRIDDAVAVLKSTDEQPNPPQPKE